MRFLLGVAAAFGLVLTVAACDNNGPDQIPRTVPPATVNSSTTPHPVIRGEGPIYET